MSIFRQFIAPLLIVLVFLVAMVAVSARIFLASDMAAPAPIEEPISSTEGTVADPHASLPPTLKVLIEGMPDDLVAPTSM
jgi:hypothetical protein